MIHNRYGIDDVCLSLPFVVGIHGIRREINPPLLDEEIAKGTIRISLGKNNTKEEARQIGLAIKKIIG